MKRYPDFIFYLANEWEVHHRPTGIYRALAAQIAWSGSKVFCVNRPVCPFTTPWLHPQKFLRWMKSRDRLIRIADNLFVFLPAVLLHDLLAIRVPLLLRINRYFLRKNILHVLDVLQFNAEYRIGWLYDPLMISYWGLAGETQYVYECCDEYMEGPSISNWRKVLTQELERKVLAQADLVFCTSVGLYERKKGTNPNTYLSPNAADIDVLVRTQDPRTPIAEFMRHLQHPIVGYLGTIHEHTDIALMRYIAESRPNWTIVMIGPEHQKSFSRSELFARFRSLPNVKLTGWVDREDLPSFCKAFDVCVIPYRTDSAFNRYVNPNKLHEYTAMGKPVVSTDLPEVQSYKDIIKIAKTPQEFVRAIEEWLREDAPERVQERLRIARENSWDMRVKEMLNIIQEKLGVSNCV